MTRFSTFFFMKFILIFAFIFTSCQTSFKTESLTYSNYRINGGYGEQSHVERIIRPYADSVNKSMNEVIGYVAADLEKKQPESLLGNFMTDAVLTMARIKYGAYVDAAFINYGGIRLNQLPSGAVTRGKIFELMPFDNLLIIQRLNGETLQQFLNLIADRGGWPVAGITMKLKNKKAVKVMIRGKPLDPSHEYVIANSDYIANGGDNADMLKTIPQQSIGYLVRDALFDYISILKNQGKNISSKLENRISYAQ